MQRVLYVVRTSYSIEDIDSDYLQGEGDIVAIRSTFDEAKLVATVTAEAIAEKYKTEGEAGILIRVQPSTDGLDINIIDETGDDFLLETVNIVEVKDIDQCPSNVYVLISDAGYCIHASTASLAEVQEFYPEYDVRQLCPTGVSPNTFRLRVTTETSLDLS